jgi:hypothetical protein
MTQIPKNLPNYWTADGQLSEMGLSVCAEAVLANTYHQLPAELTAYLAENIQAKAEMLALCALLQQFQSPVQVNIPHPITAKPMNTSKPSFSPTLRYSIAAALTLLLLVGGAYYLGVFSPTNGDPHANELMVENQLGGTTMPIPDSSNEQHTPNVSQPASSIEEKSTPQPTENTAIAQNTPTQPLAPKTTAQPKPNTTSTEATNDPYAPSEQHELYLLSSLRSSGLVARVQSPAIGQEYRGQITFKWDVAKNNKPYTQPIQLEIRNNRNTVVLEKTMSGQVNYTLENKLPKGLYYWFISNEEESIHMGKFKVMQ